MAMVVVRIDEECEDWRGGEDRTRGTTTRGGQEDGQEGGTRAGGREDERTRGRPGGREDEKARRGPRGRTEDEDERGSRRGNRDDDGIVLRGADTPHYRRHHPTRPPRLLSRASVRRWVTTADSLRQADGGRLLKNCGSLDGARQILLSRSYRPLSTKRERSVRLSKAIDR